MASRSNSLYCLKYFQFLFTAFTFALTIYFFVGHLSQFDFTNLSHYAVFLLLLMCAGITITGFVGALLESASLLSFFGICQSVPVVYGLFHFFTSVTQFFGHDVERVIAVFFAGLILMVLITIVLYLPFGLINAIRNEKSQLKVDEILQSFEYTPPPVYKATSFPDSKYHYTYQFVHSPKHAKFSDI